MIIIEEEFTEKQVLIFIKNKGTVKLSEIMAEYGKSNYMTRSIISKPLILNTLKEERIKGDSIITFVGAGDGSKKKDIVQDEVIPVIDSKVVNIVSKKELIIDTSKMCPVPKQSKYFHVTGIGTLSPELLSQLFSENILVIDVEKLIKKMNTSTLKIQNDKISFDLVDD